MAVLKWMKNVIAWIIFNCPLVFELLGRLSVVYRSGQKRDPAQK